MNLRESVNFEKYSGLIVIPDLHDDVISLRNAMAYAKEHNLFIVLLGDLSDGENDVDPTELLREVRDIIVSGGGAMVYGNHDDKFIRYAMGNHVILGDYQERTLERTNGKQDEFLSLYLEIKENVLSNYFFNIDDFYFAHAGVHPKMFTELNLNRDNKSRIMHGMTNGMVNERGFPVRIYGWMNEIPDGKQLFVGHDRSPLGRDTPIRHPVINKGTNGQNVYFMDTGCGKGGFLTTAILEFHDDKLSFCRFKTFEEL